MRRRKIITSECWAIILPTNQMYNIYISYNDMTDVNVNKLAILQTRMQRV